MSQSKITFRVWSCWTMRWEGAVTNTVRLLNLHCEARTSFSESARLMSSKKGFFLPWSGPWRYVLLTELKTVRVKVQGADREVYRIAHKDLDLDFLFVMRHSGYFLWALWELTKKYVLVLWYFLWWNHCGVGQNEAGWRSSVRGGPLQKICLKHR